MTSKHLARSFPDFMQHPSSPTRQIDYLLLCTGIFMGVFLFGSPMPKVLYGVDAACYARIAMDLAHKPFQQWHSLELAGQLFVDHPPLALWLEGLWLKWLGPEPEQLIWLARSYMLLLCLCLAQLVCHWSHPRVAVWTLVSMLLLPGFHFEAHNPMLELPFTLAMMGAVLASTWSNPWLVAMGFTLCSTAAWLIKGPVASLLWIYVVLFGRLQSKHKAYGLGWATLLSLGLVALVFLWLGTDYIQGYWQHQVFASLFQQRDQHAVRHSFWFYPKAVWGWYAPGVLCGPIVIWRMVRQNHFHREQKAIAMVGFMLLGTLVFFMTIPKQNYWYIHPMLPWFAWMMGWMWHQLLPPLHQLRFLSLIFFVGLLFMALGTFFPKRWYSKQQSLITIHTHPQPLFEANQPKEVANCSSVQGWRADHLFALKWQVRAAPCDALAPYVLYNDRLQPRSD